MGWVGVQWGGVGACMCPVPSRPTTPLLPATCCTAACYPLPATYCLLLAAGCCKPPAASCCFLLLLLMPAAAACAAACRRRRRRRRPALPFFPFRLRNPNFCPRAAVALRRGEGKPAASDLRRENLHLRDVAGTPRRDVGINVGGKISRVLPRPKIGRRLHTTAVEPPPRHQQTRTKPPNAKAQ